MSRPSLGVVLVVMGNPGVRGDIRMSGFSSTASLDEVCDILSAGSDSRRRALRINAMRALGKYVEKNFTNARKAARWLSQAHRRLGVWAAASCAREVLHLVPKNENRPRVAIETAEAWVRGEATSTQANKAAAEAYAAASYAENYSDNASEASEGAYAARAASYAARAADAYANDAYAGYAADAASYAADAANIVSANDETAWDDSREAELRRLVTVISERLVLFPEWTGKPSDDRWPLPTKRNR